MGKIWIQTPSGKIIHLPIVEDDFNSPDDAVRIPTAVLINRNRCFSGTIQIVSPEFGTITFDFTEVGRTGECNQCGQCCTHPADACPNPGNCGWPLRTIRNKPDFHACQYLTIFKDNKWGDPDNTECSIYTNLINTFKGCMYPLNQSDWEPHMTSCGFSWS